MPKRKNPFGEITPLQLKTHVGFEQMATQQEREQVYGEAAGAWPRPDVLPFVDVTYRQRDNYFHLFLYAERTKALLFQAANPSTDISRALGLVAPTPQLSSQHSTGSRLLHTLSASRPQTQFTDQQSQPFVFNGGQSPFTRVEPGAGRGNHSSAGLVSAGNGTSTTSSNGACGGASITHLVGGSSRNGSSGETARLVGGGETVCASGPGQPELSSYFSQLQSSAGARNGGLQWRGGGGGRGRGACRGCRQSAVGMWRCEHCEVAVCADCRRECCVCLSLFCPYCSVLK